MTGAAKEFVYHAPDGTYSLLLLLGCGSLLCGGLLRSLLGRILHRVNLPNIEICDRNIAV